MQAILGKVKELDARAKTFTVTAVLPGPGGRDKTKNFQVSWSRDTAFMSKGRRKVRSSAEKVKPGMEVIVQLGGRGRPADVVWHEPTRSPTIALTATECKDLGGTISEDSDCPNVGAGPGNPGQTRRCKTSGGTKCINES